MTSSKIVISFSVVLIAIFCAITITSCLLILNYGGVAPLKDYKISECVLSNYTIVNSYESEGCGYIPIYKEEKTLKSVAISPFSYVQSSKVANQIAKTYPLLESVECACPTNSQKISEYPGLTYKSKCQALEVCYLNVQLIDYFSNDKSISLKLWVIISLGSVGLLIVLLLGVIACCCGGAIDRCCGYTGHGGYGGYGRCCGGCCKNKEEYNPLNVNHYDKFVGQGTL